MDKTININLGGSLFQVDEEAFLILRDYIQSINNRFRNVQGGPETIEDIESRIAEIFNSKKGVAGIITRQNVEEMISIIGKPEDFDSDSDTGYTQAQASQVASPKRLYRNPHDTVIGGVCGGLGAWLNTDPVLFRVIFVITAFFGLIGLFVYLVLWIAVPKADSDQKLREMYGSTMYDIRKQGGYLNTSYKNYNNSGLNEVVNATGKVLYAILRIFLIVVGATLLVTGFLVILAFIMIFVFKIPGSFSNHGVDFPLYYVPDLLNYIFSPEAAPWIYALSAIVLILPMLALIYWGVKMIFWFRARDGWFSLVAFLVWVLAAGALSIILFNEGISFAESSSTTARNILPKNPKTLYIVTRNSIDDLNVRDEFVIPDDSYRIFVADDDRNIYVNPGLKISVSESDRTEVEVRKRSSGRTRRDAARHAESLVYEYENRSDTLLLDEYFMIPSERKWAADFVTINLTLPEGTVVYFDKWTAGLLDNRTRIEGFGYSRNYQDRADQIGGMYWIVTEDGLKQAETKR
jgi:phage shock protein PspC (stress-responsive transcriptional regulator)